MSLNVHHRRALGVFAVTAFLVVALGTLMGAAEHVSAWHGMYCTTGFATTAGCDLTVRTWQEYALGELSMILMVPLFTSVFALVTTGLTADHVDLRHGEMADHVTTTAGGGA